MKSCLPDHVPVREVEVCPPEQDGLRPAVLVCAPGPDEPEVLERLARLLAEAVLESDP